MYMGHPSNELERFIVWRNISSSMYEPSAEDQVRTVVMCSEDINDDIRSFSNRYRFLFSIDIARHYTSIFSGSLDN